MLSSQESYRAATTLLRRAFRPTLEVSQEGGGVVTATVTAIPATTLLSLVRYLPLFMVEVTPVAAHAVRVRVTPREAPEVGWRELLASLS